MLGYLFGASSGGGTGGERISLFHGTPLSKWLSVLRNGLLMLSNTPYMSTGAVYGAGVYFGKHFSTSHAYCQAPLTPATSGVAQSGPPAGPAVPGEVSATSSATTSQDSFATAKPDTRDEEIDSMTRLPAVRVDWSYAWCVGVAEMDRSAATDYVGAAGLGSGGIVTCAQDTQIALTHLLVPTPPNAIT